MEDFQADPEANFGYVGLAFPSAKDFRAAVRRPASQDPSYPTCNPDRCTCAMLAGQGVTPRPADLALKELSMPFTLLDL